MRARRLVEMATNSIADALAKLRQRVRVCENRLTESPCLVPALGRFGNREDELAVSHIVRVSTRRADCWNRRGASTWAFRDPVGENAPVGIGSLSGNTERCDRDSRGEVPVVAVAYPAAFVEGTDPEALQLRANRCCVRDVLVGDEGACDVE